MIKVLIADDERNVREALSRMLELYGTDIVLCATSGSVDSTVSAIREHQPDIVLLDVEIDGGTGFDVLKQFPKPQFKVIFITAYEQYAVTAFRFSALDYLLKPVDPDEFIGAIKKASDVIDREKISVKIDSFLHNMTTVSKEHKRIVLKTAGHIYVVNLQDVMYCEADRSYTNFYMADSSKIMVSNTLGSYEELFEDYGFLRIHQSFLLNLNYVSSYEKGDGGMVILKNNSRLPLATRKKERFLAVLSGL